MSTQVKQKRLPNHAYLDEESVQRHAKLTKEGLYNLVPKELFWLERHRFLKDHGYQLRPRYTPNWKPSWMGTNLDPNFCEDSILLLVTFRIPQICQHAHMLCMQDYQVMDATRVANNELVAIKSFINQSQQLHIAQFLSSIPDPQNHCVKVYEILSDPYDVQRALMVMPYLRPCNDPDFSTIGDIVQFVDQTIDVSLQITTRPNSSHVDRRDSSSCTSIM